MNTAAALTAARAWLAQDPDAETRAELSALVAAAEAGEDAAASDLVDRFATRLAFGTAVDADGVSVEGISRVQPLDLRMADELGYRIKLLGVAQATEAGIEQRGHPTMVPKSSAIAQVMGVTHAGTIGADAVDDTAVARLANEGLLLRDAARLRVTDRGMLLRDAILPSIVR